MLKPEQTEHARTLIAKDGLPRIVAGTVGIGKSTIHQTLKGAA